MTTYESKVSTRRGPPAWRQLLATVLHAVPWGEVGPFVAIAAYVAVLCWAVAR